MSERIARMKEISIFNLMTKPMAEKIDEVAYNFLRKEGYIVPEDIRNNKQAQERIKTELESDNLVLKYKEKANDKDGHILFWFELQNKNTNEVKAISQGIKFIFKEIKPTKNKEEESFEMIVPVENGEQV